MNSLHVTYVTLNFYNLHINDLKIMSKNVNKILLSFP
jgi:hypothetical protein